MTVTPVSSVPSWIATANAPGTIPVSSSTGRSPTSSSTDGAANALGSMGPDAFLKLLVAQMRYQNPLSPSDPSAMLGQVAQFTQVEALQKLQAGQTTSASLEKARMAADVVGKYVTGTSDTGVALSGMVSSARFTPSGPMLKLDSGTEMALASIETIATSKPLPALTTTPTPAAPTPAATTPAATTPVATTPVATTPASPDTTSGAHG